jgi:hypothetical protein
MPDDALPAPRLTRSMAKAAVTLKLMSPGKQPEGKSKSEKGKTVAERNKKSRDSTASLLTDKTGVKRRNTSRSEGYGEDRDKDCF